MKGRNPSTEVSKKQTMYWRLRYQLSASLSAESQISLTWVPSGVPVEEVFESAKSMFAANCIRRNLKIDVETLPVFYVTNSDNTVVYGWAIEWRRKYLGNFNKGDENG